MGDPRVETQPLKQSPDSASLRNSFEKNQADARHLFGIVLSCTPPLLEMSLEQASPFVRLVNIVRRSVYIPSRVDGLPQQVFTRHAQPLRTRKISQRYPLSEVSAVTIRAV